LGAVWQKNGGGRSKKGHFFSCFFVFLGFLAPEGVEAQGFLRICLLPKKSRLKTYGRFLGFGRFW
jgi:hypothetical protein